MLVDLGRNDIGRVSQPGTVTVKDFMIVERYSHVMHLVSRVEGKLKPEMSAYDALRACFPAGTLSGAPKIRAMEIISEMETDRRGPYGGAVGYFDFSGNMDTAITIRTMVMKDGVAHIQAGGGVVYDSVPEREYQETLNKARAVMQAIDHAEAMEEGLVTAGSLGY
jgi:anthranilate synthase component 1